MNPAEPEHQDVVVWKAARPPAEPPVAVPKAVNWTTAVPVVLFLLVLCFYFPRDFPRFLVLPICAMYAVAAVAAMLWQRHLLHRPIGLAELRLNRTEQVLTILTRADPVYVRVVRVTRVEVRRSSPAGARLRILVETNGKRYDTGDTTGESARPMLDALRAAGVQLGTELG